MNKKKLYLVGTFFVLAASGMNVFARTNTSPFDGFYAGINAGAAFTTGKISNTSSATFINLFDNNNQLASSQSVNVASTQGGGSIFAGYGQMLGCSSFYLAGEIFGNTYQRESTLRDYAFHAEPDDDEDFESLTTRTKANLNNGEFGIDLRPGVLLLGNHTLLYGRVGVAFNKLHLNSDNDFSFTFLGSDPPITTDSFLSESQTKSVSALRLGLGLESYICKNLALTVDYIYTSYGKINASNTGDVTTVIEGGPTLAQSSSDTFVVSDGLVNQSSANLNTQTVTLGIKYYFG